MKLPFLTLLLASSIHAATLPGFRVETLTRTTGFVSSVVTDSHGTVYFTTTDGWIHRVDGTHDILVTALPTHEGGNGGLLGMAMLDDSTAVVHYTTWSNQVVLDDVISKVDLATGAESVLHSFVCDIDVRSRGASAEHHGGNPTVAADGAVFVGIGEYNTYSIAQKPEWNGGKIWRIDAGGNATQWALGMRNPYDLAWDPELNAVVITDNGASAGDELNVVPEGSNCGWPVTYGNHPPLEGAVVPSYVFPTTVAPTGLLRLKNDANEILRRGYLSGAFVTKAIYYFPTVTTDPIAILEDFGEFVIDVTQAPNGDILFATAMGSTCAIHRLIVPARGDCNGDGLVSSLDVVPLLREINDGQSHPTTSAQSGDYPGSWGCDVNADNVIDTDDLAALISLLDVRRRAVRSR